MTCSVAEGILCLAPAGIGPLIPDTGVLCRPGQGLNPSETSATRLAQTQDDLDISAVGWRTNTCRKARFQAQPRTNWSLTKGPDGKT
jgi:hypothetical protein